MNLHADLPRFRAIAEQLDELCGDDETCFRDMIDGQTDVREIIERLHQLIAADMELIDGIAAREVDLKARKARLSGRLGVRKAAIGKYLRAVKLPSIQLAEATYSVRDGKPSLNVVDPDAVPEPFVRTKTEPDKAKINQHYADAKELPNWLTRDPATDIVTMRSK